MGGRPGSATARGTEGTGLVRRCGTVAVEVVVAMSRTQSSAVNVDWEEREEPTEWDKLPVWKKRRRRRLVIEYYAACLAFERSDATLENDPSLANCERSPTPEQTADTDADAGKLYRPEYEALPLVFRMGVEDVDRAREIVAGGGDRLDAIHAALERDRERQWKVLALLERGDVSHALNLATCGQRSIQLTCPEHAGGCGCEENYVPMHCDSRLCPVCQDRNTGQVIEKYRDAVFDMENPVLWTLTVENVEDPVQGRTDVMESLGKFRRRTIPFEGEVVRERDGGETITKSWSWWEGTRVEDIEENHTQWKLELQGNGRHDLVRRLQKQYVNYEYENITGTHVGRNIPMDELIDGGIYGIDIKQKGAFEYNVHAHVLVDAAYVPQAALSATWEDITGDPVVDVRRIYDRSTKQSVAEALAETVGYAVKPPEFEELDDELEFVEAAKGCPTVHPFGSLHGAGSSEGGMLFCSNCEMTPRQWEYNGICNEALDTMGKAWETDRGKDPPE
jgi:hypothetical protein